MPRYIRRFSRIGQSLGPSEERDFELWAGYDLEPPPEDPDALGLIDVTGWSAERLAERGVVAFRRATADDLARWVDADRRR